MGGKWEARRNATDSDARRMYIRGRKGILKVISRPLDETLAAAKMIPKTQVEKAKPLAPDVEVVSVTALEAAQSMRPKKSGKGQWAAGHSKSGSVLGPKLQPRRPQKSEPSPKSHTPDKSPTPEKISASKPKTEGRKRRRKKRLKKGNATRKSFGAQFEGQPRYESGIRFYQGGLPEQGKR